MSTHALPTILALDMPLDAFARRHGEYGKSIYDALREAGGVFAGVSRGTDDGEREQTIKAVRTNNKEKTGK